MPQPTRHLTPLLSHHPPFPVFLPCSQLPTVIVIMLIVMLLLFCDCVSLLFFLTGRKHPGYCLSLGGCFTVLTCDLVQYANLQSDMRCSSRHLPLTIGVACFYISRNLSFNRN
ncbi:membrane-associated protein, putative [Bodo saltans]|uniref:Membrane-associated protein, putative n=1 Tax=Bodo saltans TaxID=75058 RepID=A0A0S4JL42_BODSA|nr:membrane-associated protein, putative [Bodo saltans]|eukprot:CUG92250.1 membrane-associated protein, putative [Bodo saltans]